MNQTQKISFVPRKVATVIGLVTALILPIILLKLTMDGWVSGLGFELGCWLIAIGLIAYSIQFEKLPIGTLGFRSIRLNDFLWAIGLGGSLICLFFLSNAFIKWLGFGDSLEALKVIGGMPKFSLFMLALRAAFTEEVIYRAYPMGRIISLTGNKILAASIPLFFFVLSHLSWGVGHLLFVTLGGLLFALVYLKKRNIWINIIGHFIVDFSILLLVLLLV